VAPPEPPGPELRELARTRERAAAQEAGREAAAEVRAVAWAVRAAPRGPMQEVAAAGRAAVRPVPPRGAPQVALAGRRVGPPVREGKPVSGEAPRAGARVPAGEPEAPE